MEYKDKGMARLDRVRKDIFDTIEDRDIELKVVAKHLGITQNYLNKCKLGERNLNFRCLLKLAYFLFPNEPHKKMHKWALGLDSVELIKHAFEYAAIIRNTKLLRELLDLHQESFSKLKECVQVYTFILEYMNDKTANYNIAGKLKEIKYIKDPNLQILLSIYKCIDMYLKRKFTLITEFAEEIEIKIREIGDERNLFIKECFVHRLSEILSHTNLHLNNIPKAMHYSWMIINANISPKTKSDGFYVLSLCHLNKDENKCLHYINESLKCMQETKVPYLIEFANYNVNFVRLLLNKELPIDSCPSLKAVESVKTCKQSADDVREEVEKSGDEDLISYFAAISCESVTSLITIFHTYLAKANMFYASIVVGELIRRGENSDFVNSLVNISLNNTNNLGDDLFEKTFICSFGGGTSDLGSICA